MSKKIKSDPHLQKAKGPLLLTESKYSYSDLTKSQKYATELFDDWFFTNKSKKHQILRIGGGAGSGKSTWLKYILSKYNFTQEDCLVVSYTGQAVNVLRRAGIMAKTIHSTFMYAVDRPILDKDHKPITKCGIPLTKTEFVPIKSIPSEIKLIIIDESSFVSAGLEKIIASYAVPILETGDPFQLPPVAGKQCFCSENLNFVMTDIVRQDKDNDIVRLATAIRNGEPINFSDFEWGDVLFLWQQETVEDTFHRYYPFVKSADIIVTSTNKQRSTICDIYRDEIIKTESPFPVKGEKLICRRNDWSLTLGPYPLTNGTQGTAVHSVGKSMVDRPTKTYLLDFQPTFVEDGMYFDNLLCDSEYIQHEFGDKDVEDFSKYNPGHKFEYGYAITTHLAQGSEYDTVMFFDSLSRDPIYQARLRYTAVTRARKRVIWLLPRYVTSTGKLWSDLTVMRNGGI